MKRRKKPTAPRKTAPQTAVSWRERWDKFYDQAYAVCYVVGARSVRCVRSLVRFTRVLWRPIAYLLIGVLTVLVLRPAQRVWHMLRSFLRDAVAAVRRAKRNPEQTWRQLLQLPAKAVQRYPKVFRALCNVGAPIAASLVLIAVITYWQGAEFVLSVEYDGNILGFIANENTYKQAALTVEGLVIDTDNSFQVETSPKMTVAVAKADTALDEQALADAILKTVSGSVTETAGLFIDDVFQGAYDRTQLEQLMAETLSTYEDADADYIDFFPKMEVVDGLYPTKSVRTEEQMRICLKAVPIKSVTRVTRTETLPYTTEVRETPEQPLGYQTVLVQGKAGKQKVTEEIISVDGKEQYRTVVATEVLQEAVQQVLLVGAQAYSTESKPGDGIAKGNFVWPVPYTKVVSSPFASRWGRFHGAIDIANGSTNGKPIIASDGGVVLEAEYHHSYGYYVLIDHGNGFKTRYAHCSSLNVVAGQKVAQGEYIGNVGNTGYSFGAHLHFEIIKNGKLVDPLDYVER